MLVLVSGATTTMANHQTSGLFGQLFVPGGNSPAVLNGTHYAIDNGGYLGVDVAAFLALLKQFRAHRRRCLFVTCPDIVGKAVETMDLFEFWRPIIGLALGYPVALVAQDGLESLRVPWNTFEALFIGGTTDWKLSKAARHLCSMAKAHGKWVHVGRVNSERRFKMTLRMGADSVDGTAISRWSQVFAPKFERWLRTYHEQPEFHL